MNPWSPQKQREKALQRYYDRANPQPKKQENDMAYDPMEQERRQREVERVREQEYTRMKQAQMMQLQQQMQYYYAHTDPRKPSLEALEKSASTECIVGLRVWKVVDDKGLPKLASVVKSSVLWPYRKALERDPIMAEGIHAVRPGDRVVDLFREYQAHVAGEVYLWGKVIECDEGWLADCAYPKRLLIPSCFDPIKAMQLEDEYGVPCEFREELAADSAANRTATAVQMMQAQAQAGLVYGAYPQSLLNGFTGGAWRP